MKQEKRVDNAEYVYASGCTWLTELAAPNAEHVYASGCTGLTELAAPNAKYVDASGCTGLTELAAPNAKTVYASGCTGLTELAAPNAKTVDASGCTGLTLDKIKVPFEIKFYWHIHHEELYELNIEPIQKRINYIKRDKPPEQIETRLRLLKPVKDQAKIQELVMKADKDGIAALHNYECPGCPWDGKTIFAK